MESILKILLTAGFTLFGMGKILPIPKIHDMQSETFKGFGLNDNLMRLTGLGELLGVALIWFGIINDNEMFGAATLGAIALAASGFHTKFKDWKNLPPAVVMSILSILLLISVT